ncbi:type IV toxin-antitoxin system AbiEi family antitoxin (plasmid) [Paraburkholderia sp. PREW-6R]|uniref:type IV toxin-antitoxin system AbiEi family antitoxin n=1 Tax=Paraburkholderia sp. PREW-6R TaxID=3141544 RepID=UPI0031F56FE9
MATRPAIALSEQRLLDEACAAFQRASGRFKAKPVMARASSDRPVAGGEIRFDVSGKRFVLPCALKERIGEAAAVATRRTRSSQRANPPVVQVTRFVSPELALDLIANGIPFLDTAGNAYLDVPEATVMITGRPRPAPVVPPGSARSTTPKGLRVMYAIATTPGLIAQPYRSIAGVSGVALNTVNKAVDDLIARGLVAEKKSGVRIVPDWKRFVSEWVNLYPSQLRHKLASRRFASASPDWWQSFDFAPFAKALDLRLGGEAAAQALTHLLQASKTTVYTQGPLPAQFMLAARLRPDERGDVEVLDAFWPRAAIYTGTPPDQLPLVHPLLIYADLVATGDSRNLSIAQQIYDEHVAPLQS